MNKGQLTFSKGSKSYILTIYNVPEERFKGNIKSEEWNQLAQLVEEILIETGLLENGDLATAGARIGDFGASDLTKGVQPKKHDISKQYDQISTILLGNSISKEKPVNSMEEYEILKKNVVFYENQLKGLEKHLKTALLKIKNFEETEKIMKVDLEQERLTSTRFSELFIEEKTKSRQLTEELEKTRRLLTMKN